MKRFTNDDMNEQEGWELIPTQRSGEEEAPLDLSFEGGEAGARRYSRRQALGLLGGSVAGVSMLSLGLVAPAKSRNYAVGIPAFRSYDHIALEFRATHNVHGDWITPQNRFLDGRTQDGTVGLAPHTNPPFTGTRWEVKELLGSWPRYSRWAFKCLGDIPGNRWLDGRTADSTVGLAPHGRPPFTGTRWEVHIWGAEPEGAAPEPTIVHLKCLGHLPGVPWLRGFPFRPPNGTVGLDGEYSYWRVHKLPK
jgi:hypothetical protein